MTLSPRTGIAQADNLSQYINCNFGAKVSVEESDENAQSFVRSVNTANGQKNVVVRHGFSLHIAYVGPPFVNFKAERLASLDSAKRNLIQSMSVMAKGTRDMESNTPRQSALNGFDIYAINRTKLAGGVESVYAFPRRRPDRGNALHPEYAARGRAVLDYRAVRRVT
jgi:hypothetical protein